MLLVLVCEGEEKFLHKGMGGETLKSWRKGRGSKTLGKFRKEAARCDQRSLRIGGREEEGRTETRLEAGYG